MSLARLPFSRFLSHLRHIPCLLGLLSLSSQTCFPATSRLGFVVANEPHVKPIQISLGFGLRVLAPHFIFTEVGRKERLERGGKEETEKHTQRPFYSREEEQMFPMLYFPRLEWLRCGGIIPGCSQGSRWGV